MTKFLGFGQLTRPDIGLIADGVQNLAEIYKSDQDTALRNVRLSPEILDIIYGLSNTISKEDLRAVSGLSSLLLPTLHLQSSTFSNINNSLDSYVNSRKAIGVDGSKNGALVKVENVMLYNGSIQCEGVTYKTKVLNPDTGLYSGASIKQTAVSTSRASLFNAEQDTIGYFNSATYTGSIRVRRRSHVNRITLNPYTFVPRAPVNESPSHKINCYVGEGDTRGARARKLGLLATKNSPLKFPCRMNVGTINIGFQDAAAPYFFGYQVQPLESRDGGIPGFLPLDPGQQLEGSTSHTVTIDVSKAGYQNSYDLYVYLYLNPDKVTSLSFSGMSITEFMRAGGKDIGLVGFNNLESLTLNGTSMQILPVWLKTLSTKLKNLNIANAGDSFIEGPLRYFDYRDSSATPSASLPFYTMVSYLTLPSKGAFINTDGDNWNGESGTYNPATHDNNNFAKYVKDLSRTAGTHFRQFGAMETLTLGNRVLGLNPRCDDVFPNLRTLNWYGGRNRAPISGTLPKINNNGNAITYNVYYSGASGSIENIGTSSTITDNTVNGACHISKYRIEGFNVQGNWWLYSSVTGNIGSAGTPASESEWDTWFSKTKSISVYYASVSVNLQPTTPWASLQSLSMYNSQGTVFKAGSPPLNIPNVPSIDLYSTPTTGPVPTLGTQANTNKLSYFRLGSQNSLTTIAESGFNYLLPTDFATNRGDAGSDHKLSSFVFYGGSLDAQARIRPYDFKHCYNLTYLFFRNSAIVGSFPYFPTKRNPSTEQKDISVDFAGSRFYDLTTISINESNSYIARDLIGIYGPSNNTSGGGCKLPDFKGFSASRLSSVVLNESLTSTYPSNWNGNLQSAGQYIFDTDGSTNAASQVTGLTVNVQVNNSGTDNEDPIYYLSGAGDYRLKVLVNDVVTTSGSSELARVINVDSTRIYLDKNPNTTATTFQFARKTQDITDWFERGFSKLNRFNARNCRLSGSINIRAGFSSIADGGSGEYALDLSRNVLTGYTEGFNRIFSGSNRRISLNLSYNNFSVAVIRDMLTELFAIEKAGGFTIVRVDLNNTKFNSTTRGYDSYRSEDLFSNTIQSIPSQTVSLTRIERIKVYETITTTAEDGTTSTETRVVGAKNVTVPGKDIGGTYYKTKTNGRQQVIEDPLGAAYAALQARNRWIVNLGNPYSPPDTTPTVTGSTYSDTTTRANSLAELGYTLDDLA